jgi:hypothetical protein
MTKNLIKKLVFAWTVLTLLIDISGAIQIDTAIDRYWLIFVFVGIDIIICWTASQMLIGRRWALVTLIFYFGLRTLSIYPHEFTFYIQSGLNVEILLNKTIGINLTWLIALILMIRELNRTAEMNDEKELVANKTQLKL